MQKFAIIWIFSATLLFSCSQEEKKPNAPISAKKIINNQGDSGGNKTEYCIKTFQSENGWGYTIFENQKAFIIQKSIPSVPGVNGFDSELNARKCAEFVMQKLINGEMPPSVTPQELDSLEVL